MNGGCPICVRTDRMFVKDGMWRWLWLDKMESITVVLLDVGADNELAGEEERKEWIA